MAVKPYQEGSVWSFRLRFKGEDIYQTGYATKSQAANEAERLRQQILLAGQPKHEGPRRMSLGRALQLYGLERLQFNKGARQESGRINRYLRAAGLDIIKVESVPSEQASEGTYFKVTLVRERGSRKIPNSLREHRKKLVHRTQQTERLMARLATTVMAKVASYQLQELVDTMRREGYKPASIGLERALIRRLFAYAKNNWLWAEPARNPATALDLPKIDNGRDRILSNAEWRALLPELQRNPNPYVAPAIALLLETAMRVSEPLMHASWDCIDWDACVLRLKTAKAGARAVPLNPQAIAILKALRTLKDQKDQEAIAAYERRKKRNQHCAMPTPDSRVLPITYEALKAAWTRACTAAGIEGVRIHDLRHTAATRFTLQLNGNLPVLKIITGHRTVEQLNRYINVSPQDVARLLHDRPLTDDHAPAGMHVEAACTAALSTEDECDEVLPENVVPLNRWSRVRVGT